MQHRVDGATGKRRRALPWANDRKRQANEPYSPNAGGPSRMGGQDRIRAAKEPATREHRTRIGIRCLLCG